MIRALAGEGWDDADQFRLRVSFAALLGCRETHSWGAAPTVPGEAIKIEDPVARAAAIDPAQQESTTKLPAGYCWPTSLPRSTTQ